MSKRVFTKIDPFGGVLFMANLDGGVTEAAFIGSLLASSLAAGAELAVSALTKPTSQAPSQTYPANPVTRGGYLSYVIGRQVVGPHIGWVGARYITQIENAGNNYVEVAQHQLCHGPITKIRRIWCGGLCIWNHEIDFATVADGTSFQLPQNRGEITVYSGRDGQPVDAFLQKHTGLVSHWPGLAYVTVRFALGSSPTWGPFKYEIEAQPADLAAGCGLDLTVLGQPSWIEETTPSETVTHGAIVWFNGQQTLAAGTYTMTYVRGAFKLTSSSGWQVATNKVGGSGNEAQLTVIDQDFNSYGQIPYNTLLGQATQEQAEAANTTPTPATKTITWPGGSPIGICFYDDTDWPGVVNGQPNPTFTLQLSSGTGPTYTASAVLQGGAAGSGDSGCNPAAVLYMLLCAPFPYGCAIPTASINMPALIAAAATLAGERCVVNIKQEDGRDFSDAVQSLMGDVGFLLPQIGGLLTPYLIRNAVNIPVVADDLIEGPLPEQQRLHGPINVDRFTFQFDDVLNDFSTSDVTIDNDAQALNANRPKAHTEKLENVTNFMTANQVAIRRATQMMAAPHKVPAFTILRDGRDPQFHPGRSFLMGGIQYRLLSWKPDDKGLGAEVEAVLDQYGDTSLTIDNTQGGYNWGAPPADSVEADTDFEPIMVPAALRAQASVLSFWVPRVRANSGVINAGIWLGTASTGTFNQVGFQATASAGGDLVTAFTATAGTLTTGPKITPYPDFDDFAEVLDLTGDSASYNAGAQLLICEQEIMLLQSVTPDTSTPAYITNNITRGAFGTTVAAHAAGTACVIIQTSNMSQLTSPLLTTPGGTLWVKTQPADTQGNTVDLSAVPAEPLLPVPAPAAPAGLTAKAGDGQVTLSWTAVSGAAGYNVKRGTATGGPYTTVASVTGSTSDVDAGLTDGTAYFYVVTATVPGAESANSNEATATPMVITGGGSTPPPARGGISANLDLWLAPSSSGTTQTSGGAIISIPDLSGNSHSASTINGSGGIWFQDTAGDWCVRFTGSGSINGTLTDPDGLAGYTIFIVARCQMTDSSETNTAKAAFAVNQAASWGTIDIAPFQSFVGWRFGTRATGNDQRYTRPSNVAAGIAITAVRHDSSTETCWTSGSGPQATVTGMTGTLAGNSTTYTVGASPEGNGSWDVYELIVYKAALTDSQMAAVFSDLASAYPTHV